MLKKIMLISTVSILLAGCQSGLKNNQNDHVPKVKNIDFQAQSLKDNYFQYVNTSDLVNMPPINNDLKNYLFAQVVSNATNIRETVESREKFDDKMKDATCGDLPTKLCNYNAHLYSGSYFGLKLYEKANNQDLLGHSIVAAPLTMWSISWLKKSYSDGLNLAKQCSTADNTCLNKMQLTLLKNWLPYVKLNLLIK